MLRALIVSGTTLLLLSGLFVSARQAQNALDTTAFVCPMHPDYTLDIAGTCPRCGMALVRATPFDVRDYALEFRTRPVQPASALRATAVRRSLGEGGKAGPYGTPLVRAGEASRWNFAIRHPGTGKPVPSLEVVHERPYHLFVISQDMEHFQHIHPQQEPDLTWALDVTLPQPGYYTVLSDFLPSGGASQLISRPLVTAGYAGDLAADSARLVADTNFVKVIDDLTASVSFDPPTFVAGLYGHLIFHLTDTRTGRPDR